MIWLTLLLGVLLVLIGLSVAWGAPLVLPGAAIALLTGDSIHKACRERNRT